MEGRTDGQMCVDGWTLCRGVGKGQIREARQEEGKEFKKDSTNSLKEKFRSRRTFIMELIHKKNHFNTTKYMYYL